MTESAIANTAQHEYWNNVAGPRWVGPGGFVERRVRAVNNLLLARSAVGPGEGVLEIMGPSARLIDEKKPDDAVRATIRHEMTEAFAAYAGGKEMRLPSTAVLVTARRLL